MSEDNAEVITESAAPESAVDEVKKPARKKKESTESAAPESAVDDRVLVTAPKTFRFRPDHQQEILIPAGVQRMDRATLDHWYVKAHGVTPIEE